MIFKDKNTNTLDRPGVRVYLYGCKNDYTKKHEKQKCPRVFIAHLKG